MDEVYRPALSQPRSGDETMSENCLVKNNACPKMSVWTSSSSESMGTAHS
jgi:hypothetical protein